MRTGSQSGNDRQDASCTRLPAKDPWSTSLRCLRISLHTGSALGVLRDPFDPRRWEQLPLWDHRVGGAALDGPLLLHSVHVVSVSPADRIAGSDGTEHAVKGRNTTR